MMNHVDIKNPTIEQYLMLTQENQKDPNDYDLFAPNSHHEDKEVSSEEDVDEWLKAEIEASVNMMPKSLSEHLKLASLKETSIVVEMADITKKAPLGIMENILVKIDKFMFHFEFIVIDMLEGPNETMLLGRPFLATIHAQLDVFRREISLGIGKEKVKCDMNEGTCHSRYLLKKFTWQALFRKVNTSTLLKLKRMYSPMIPLRAYYLSKDEVRSHLVENIVSRWHVCNPILVTFTDYEKDYGMWPTCSPDLSFCSGYNAIYGKEENGMLKQWICFRDQERQNVEGNGMLFAYFLKVRYGNKNINDVTHERRYYEWESDSPPNDTLSINTYIPNTFQTQLKKPHLRDNSFEEMTRDDLYSRRFDEYKEKFDSEIEQLANEYDLRVGRKKYALDDIWEKCEKFQDTAYRWHDEGFEEDKQ
nr:hypothetical protein [Tanacetum cinerariifolium]